MSYNHYIETSLLQAVCDLQIRSAIQETLDDLVTDVEVANSLQQRLEQHAAMTEYETRCREQQTALEETVAVQSERHKKSAALADLLVKELWSVSKALGNWHELKEEHETLKAQHDEVVAKLAQAEEDFIVAREGGGSQPAAEAATASTEESKTPKSPPASPKISPPEKSEQPPVEQAPDVSTATPTAKVEAEKAIAAATPLPTEEPKAETTATTETQPVVALDEEAEDTPSLSELETPILMHIFNYLDALDILNTAQVNISMYSRIDSLFGLGSAPEDGGDNSTIATCETVPSSSQPTTSTTRTAAPSKPAAASTAVTSNLTPTIAAIKPTPQQSPKQQPPPPQQQDEAPRGIFSILQPRKTASPTRTSQHHRRSSSNVSDGAPPMNAAMANSMAAKLTDAELNAIILMTERLKQKETLAERLSKQNDELQAKLDGTESVKQFLIAKVREMELSLSSSEEMETKVAQQVASDQEVIAFLDGRIQDLERETSKLQKEKLQAMQELQRVKEQTEKKTTVMGDMLQFEREKLTESEREWKVTKKLLVKEVKSCRAQIAALQAERDGIQEQNERLRKTVLSSSSSTSHLNGREAAYS